MLVESEISPLDGVKALGIETEHVEGALHMRRHLTAALTVVQFPNCDPGASLTGPGGALVM